MPQDLPIFDPDHPDAPTTFSQWYGPLAKVAILFPELLDYLAYLYLSHSDPINTEQALVLVHKYVLKDFFPHDSSLHTRGDPEVGP